ncbi:MAG TPA: aminodeoxychorismate synthase component I [Pyrinomonadaceae bacterium]|jgi:para-aminobenzoate synthetase component 1
MLDASNMTTAKATVSELPFTADELLRALLHLAPERCVRILDSGGARGDGSEARFLIAGFDPFETVEARGHELSIQRRGETSIGVERGALLSLLDERLARYRLAHTATPRETLQLPVAGGACIAAFAYDLARQFERLRTRPPVAREADVALEPDAALAFYDTLFVHDYARNKTYLTSIAGDEGVARAHAALIEARHAGGFDGDDEPPESPGERRTVANSNFTRAEYVAAVHRIKQHIYAGDIYQANLTQQFTSRLRAGDSAARVFLRLRREHPASFAAFLRRRADTIVSASPERFLRVSPCAEDEDARRVEAWPIKGTRRRGRTSAEDARLKDELRLSAKDAAENVMIVDLLRNDLGRVCRYGTVEVGALCELQEHPTLFHLVSKVRGRLRSEVTAGELLRATFPCGSITGAPKLRAMEIIDDSERAPRGLSMGALGYFSFDGRADLSVAIRTMTIGRDRRARFNVGGGIVAESDPEAEYEESLVKARALLRALRATEEETIKDER